MKALQQRLAKMQAELDSLNAVNKSLSEQQESGSKALDAATEGLDELLEGKAEATAAVVDALQEVDAAQAELRAASTEVLRALSRPAPFLTAPLGGGDARCAIVSTLKGIPEAELHTWISHHIDDCGFSFVYLFFDDPAEIQCRREVLRHWEGRAVVVPVDETLSAEYDACQRLPVVKDRLGEDWLARQELHVEIAMGWAHARGCHWLLHIDLDELFVLQGRTAPQHFASLPEERNAMAYLNHEGVPELHRPESVSKLGVNRFEAVSLFRRNPHCFAEGYGLDDVVLSSNRMDLTKVRGSAWQTRLKVIASEPPGAGPPRSARETRARRAFAFWPKRSQEVLGSAQYFLAYANGKGAVRLGSGLLPTGVHRFGTEDLGQYWSPDEAVVFHYAHASFEAVEAKLRHLRSSTGKWWRSFAFYTRGRDLDDQALRETYEKVVCIGDAGEVAEQLETGVCLRHTAADRHLPKWLLTAMD